MEGVNGLIGAPAVRVVEEPAPGEIATAAVAPDVGERTEVVVAALVLGALALLILFRVAGFQAVVATSGKLSLGG